MALCVIVFASLSWLLFFVSLYMKNFSIVLSMGPFLTWCRISMHSLIGGNGCCCSARCLAKFDLNGFYLKSLSCSLNRVRNGRSVCPIYRLLQVVQVSW
jgi:hypothetical protein